MTGPLIANLASMPQPGANRQHSDRFPWLRTGKRFNQAFTTPSGAEAPSEVMGVNAGLTVPNMVQPISGEMHASGETNSGVPSFHNPTQPTPTGVANNSDAGPVTPGAITKPVMTPVSSPAGRPAGSTGSRLPAGAFVGNYVSNQLQPGLPGRATGGPVAAGQPVNVDETGKPETFVPNNNPAQAVKLPSAGVFNPGVSGTIIPAAVRDAVMNPDAVNAAVASPPGPDMLTAPVRPQLLTRAQKNYQDAAAALAPTGIYGINNAPQRSDYQAHGWKRVLGDIAGFGYGALAALGGSPNFVRAGEAVHDSIAIPQYGADLRTFDQSRVEAQQELPSLQRQAASEQQQNEDALRDWQRQVRDTQQQNEFNQREWQEQQQEQARLAQEAKIAAQRNATTAAAAAQRHNDAVAANTQRANEFSYREAHPRQPSPTATQNANTARSTNEVLTRLQGMKDLPTAQQWLTDNAGIIRSSGADLNKVQDYLRKRFPAVHQSALAAQFAAMFPGIKFGPQGTTPATAPAPQAPAAPAVQPQAAVPAAPQPTHPVQPGVINAAGIRAYAQAAGITPEQATRIYQQRGYSIQ